MRLYLQGYDGEAEWKPTLVQWDTGQVLCVTELEYDTAEYGQPYLHFAHADGAQVIPVMTTKTGNGLSAVYTAQVPNILLESARPINVYVYLPRTSIEESAKSRTIFIEKISVIERQNPADRFTDETGAYAGLSATEVQAVLTQYVRDLWGEAPQEGESYRSVYEGLLTSAQTAAAAAEAACQLAEQTCAATETRVSQNATAAINNAEATITNETLDGYKIRVSSTVPSASLPANYGTITFVV